MTTDELLAIVWRGRSISHSAKLAYMLGLREVSEGRAFPSVPTMAGWLDMTERRVRGVYAELVECGELVKVEPNVWAIVE